MLPDPRDLLRPNEGELAGTPFPVILNALREEERTCTLVLTLRALQKRILFEDGRPVDCESNILHETMGRFLVAKGKLTEERYREALVESAKEGVRLEDWVVRKGHVVAFELFRLLQANLALKVLDCFRWKGARWRLEGTYRTPTPMPMNAGQLLLTGVMGHVPYDTLAAHFTFPDEQRFAAVHAAPALAEVRLGPRETRLLARLKSRPSFSALLDEGFDDEEALRGLFALVLLGIAGRSEDVAERIAAPAPEKPDKPEPASPMPKAVPPPPARAETTAVAADDPLLRDRLAGEFLSHRAKDAFDLLGVTAEATPAMLRRAFLAAADRFSPVRFQAPDLREKAEVLLLAYARAFAELAEPESLAAARRRRAAAEASRAGPRKESSEFFRITTDLLDARTQFVEGMKRFEAAEFRAAVELFQYAYDIEPRAVYGAWLALSRYRDNPHAAAKTALQQLADAERDAADCEEVHAFRGEIAAAEGMHALAETSFTRAFKLAPTKTEYVDKAREARRRSERA